MLTKSYFQISFPIKDGRQGVGLDQGIRERDYHELVN